MNTYYVFVLIYRYTETWVSVYHEWITKLIHLYVSILIPLLPLLPASAFLILRAYKTNVSPEHHRYWWWISPVCSHWEVRTYSQGFNRSREMSKLSGWHPAWSAALTRDSTGAEDSSGSGSQRKGERGSRVERSRKLRVSAFLQLSCGGLDKKK